MKRLLQELSREDPDIGQRVFASIHAVNIDTFPGWKSKGEEHSFLEAYDRNDPETRDTD